MISFYFPHWHYEGLLNTSVEKFHIKVIFTPLLQLMECFERNTLCWSFLNISDLLNSLNFRPGSHGTGGRSLAYVCSPAEDLEVQGHPLQALAAHQHPHPHHHCGTVCVQNVDGEARRLQVGTVKCGKHETTNDLWLP